LYSDIPDITSFVKAVVCVY